jgi:putative flippase GtrA
MLRGDLCPDEMIFDQVERSWLLASLMGIIVGSVWNYALSSQYTWTTRMD